MSSTHFGEPIQIVKYNPTTRKHELDIKNLEAIFLDKNLDKVELAIVSIAGAFRKGKSFLLSFFLRFLNVYYGNDSGGQTNYSEWLNDKNSRLSGFAWRGGCDRHTTGIWIWSKIFTKTMPNGQQIGIVLMDTQGMFDNQTDMNSNVTIFALSTMISSIQIFNVFNNVQEDDLQHLQLFTEYGRVALESGESDSKPFQQIMFLVRDWNFPTDYSYGLLSGKKFLAEKVLQVKPDSPSEIKAVREHLRSCFDETSGFLMPHPGDKVRTNSNFDGRLSDINPEFIKYLNELVTYLLKPTNICRSGLKKLNGSSIKPRDFYNLIQQYWNVFKSGKMPQAKNILEASTEAMCLSARSDISQWYYKTMTNFSQSNDVDFPQLINCHNNLVEQAMITYDERVVMGDRQTRQKFRDDLKNMMQEHITYFLGMHQSQKSKTLEETVTKLSTEIQELRKRNKNDPSKLMIKVQKQLQEFMAVTQTQQLDRIRQMEKTVLETMREQRTQQQPKSACLIM